MILVVERKGYVDFNLRMHAFEGDVKVF